MRRAGWKVWVADELDGSYEQVPPNLLAELQRDRRWCQGNLQNSRLMFEPRLHAVHRTAFLTGVLAYASSPLWLAFLLLSTLLFAQHAGSDPTYFIEPYQLFPIWPTAQLELMLTCSASPACCCSRPRCSSLLAIVVRGEARPLRRRARLLASASIEFVHRCCWRRCACCSTRQFVLAALTGWRLDWKSPPRDDAVDAVARSRGAPWRAHDARHRLDRGDRRQQRRIPVVAVADPARPARSAIPLSVYTSRVARRPRAAPARPDADAGGSASRACSRRKRAWRRAAPTPVVATWRALVDGAHARARRRGAAGARAGARRQGRGEARRIERALRDGPAALARGDALRLLSSRQRSRVTAREVGAVAPTRAGG